ncbi:MAG TPA: low molecular weight protein-tyrosine-phosphatase [Burkholderiales bacterium]|nr:low molecular weight protein-tyrosine-phosphatase [Burkholderiales bacterium]
MKERRILFVCTGNICRSPTAEGVFRELSEKAGLELHIASAGLGDWHVGQPPDQRAQHHARNRGYDLSRQRARQVMPRDFEEFDMILAMDRGHLRALQKMAPAQHHAKIRLFVAGSDVPDPYYGGAEGFEEVLDLVEAQCRRLIDELRQSPWDPIA